MAAHPVVLLDSGQGVAESFFLEEFQKWLRLAIWERRRQRGKNPYEQTHVWIVYPRETMEFWFHRVPLDRRWKKNEWRRIVPIRRGGRKSRWSTFFQDFAHWGWGGPWPYSAPGKPRRQKRQPWLWQVHPNVKTGAIYLNPTKKDQDWIWKNRYCWKADWRVPFLALGWPWSGNLRYGFQKIARNHWVFDQESYTKARKVALHSRVWKIPWETEFWRWLDWTPRYEVAIAKPFRNPNVERQPAVALEWAYAMDVPRDRIYVPKDNGNVWDLIDATDSRMYLLATRWEDSIPFDVLAAAGRGSTVVVPDDPRFRRILGGIPDERKAFYPVRPRAASRTGGIGYDHAEVRAWLRRRFRGGVPAAAG